MLCEYHNTPVSTSPVGDDVLPTFSNFSLKIFLAAIIRSEIRLVSAVMADWTQYVPDRAIFYISGHFHP